MVAVEFVIDDADKPDGAVLHKVVNCALVYELLPDEQFVLTRQS